MEPTSDYTEHLLVGNDMMLRGAEIDEVRVKLLQRNITPSDLDLVINEIRKNYYAKKRRRGTIVVGIGSCLLVFGCIITMVLHAYGYPISYILYGPTSVGILLLLWGMIDIMGW